MRAIRRFTSEDIGAQLFPAVTTGLYKDTLDALREYVQNAIDAKAKRVQITLNPDVVSVKDDGTGMTPRRAQESIRLGVSEKNPVQHVGFRGIGIYSSFELCERLEVHTRSRRAAAPSVITIDFGAIRDMLADEERLRRDKRPPQLHLQKMLSQAVSVEQDKDTPLDLPGTIVLLVGLRQDVFKRLNDEREVTRYLQNTVPLPFHPAFRFDKKIDAKFRKEDYRTVELELVISGKKVSVYRPYTNDIFHHHGKFPPEFFPVTSPSTEVRYGFAWVCFNDARRVLPNTELRGLLLKKYGFSIGDRNYLEPYFRRTVFSRRITGEVIVQHNDLIPNAGRTDFENNTTRRDFQLALVDLVQRVSKRANDIQEELKGREELDEIWPRAHEIVREMAGSRRDVNRLLELNIELADLSGRLTTHEGPIKALDSKRYEKSKERLEEARQTIADLLSKQPKRRPIDLAQQAARRGREAQGGEDTPHRYDRPTTVTGVLESLDIVVTSPIRTAIAYIDETILRPRLSQPDYEKELEALRDYLEENV